MNILVEEVDFSKLSTVETEAIKNAEAEAMEFYGTIEAEENNRLRLEDLFKITRHFIFSRYIAAQNIHDELKDNALFTDEELNLLVEAAGNAANDNMSSYHVLRWTREVTAAFRYQKAGNYSDDNDATAKLIARIPTR